MMHKKASKLWLSALLLASILLCLSLPLQSKAEPKTHKPLPEYNYKEPKKRQASDPMVLQPTVKPGPEIPGYNKWDKWAMLQVRVIDADTKKPLPNTEVVVAENGYRTKTNEKGITPAFPAPVIRDPRFTETLARLHGQLTLIAYKNGYWDTIYYNVRMNEGTLTTPEMWMFEITPENRRIEPYVYHYPTHHLFNVNLAAQFRSKTQPGAGPENPNR
jgi:hypothetical protein